MKVILLENVRKIGSIGEIIDVKRGFARNYLISKKKALFASKENIKEVEKIKQDLNKKDQEKKREAKNTEEKIQNKQYEIKKLSTENKELYGSVKPTDSLAYAAKIIKEHMDVFINFDESKIKDEPEVEEVAEPLNENLYRSVSELELSVRSINCLQNAKIETIGDLVQKSEPEMLKTKNFGRKSLNEIKVILTDMGLSLGTSLENFDPMNNPHDS